MKTILLTNHYPAEPFKIAKEALPEGFRLVMLDKNTPECVQALAPEADYILASGRVKLDKAVLDRAVKLKMVQRTGVGLDSLDLAELKKRNIPLYVNQGVNAQSVAEHTLLLMLACLRKLPVLHRNTAKGIWKKQEQGVQTYELAGRTVGLVGMGHIAQTVVKLLKPFGVAVLYYDPYRLTAEREAALGVEYREFAEFAGEADILSFHCPLTDGTAKMLNKKVLDTMKDGAVVINTARGGLIEGADLAEALRSGKISFAGLDVHEEEPIREDYALLSLENVILTPHIGGVTYDSFRSMMRDAMRNISLFDQGALEQIRSCLYIL